jgi:hypothetical protein
METLGRDHERAVLHGADRVAVAGRLLAFRDLEEGKQAVITISKKQWRTRS